MKNNLIKIAALLLLVLTNSILTVTAAADDVKTIIGWLDQSKYPLIVQLPETIYADVKKEWDLPDLETTTVHKEL